MNQEDVRVIAIVSRSTELNRERFDGLEGVDLVGYTQDHLGPSPAAGRRSDGRQCARIRGDRLRAEVVGVAEFAPPRRSTHCVTASR